MKIPRGWLAVVLLLGLGLIGVSTEAQDAGQSKTADGITVYIGIVPAEVIKGHRPEHAEAQAHGGLPAGKHEYHLIAAVFDSASGARIEDAQVTAHVASVGFGGTPKALEPMRIADTVTYGNYFDLPDRGPYSIFVAIRRSGERVEFTFDYTR